MSDKSETWLLDTHAWVWMLTGQGKRDFTRHLPDRAEVAVSAISVWEVAMLESKGRLKFHMSLSEWIRQALSRVELSPLSPDISIQSATLPGVFHGDPADRIITATALLRQWPLITADKSILRYMKKRHLPHMDIS